MTMDVSFVKMSFPELVARCVLAGAGTFLFTYSLLFELPIVAFGSYSFFFFLKFAGFFVGAGLFVFAFLAGYKTSVFVPEDYVHKSFLEPPEKKEVVVEKVPFGITKEGDGVGCGVN